MSFGSRGYFDFDILEILEQQFLTVLCFNQDML